MTKYPGSVIFIILISIVFAASGCFPDYKATSIPPESLQSRANITTPTKAYLSDASIVLYPAGFHLFGGSVVGICQRFWLDRSDPAPRSQKIPLDSIVAMTSYSSELSGGKSVASFLLVVGGGSLTSLSIYCLSCPKCCFGSCPTVYSVDSGTTTLEAELFSRSISKLLEEDDLDVFAGKAGRDGQFHLLLTNEALETHFIDKFRLLAVKHPRGSRVLPSPEHDFITVQELHPPRTATNLDGTDVMEEISAAEDSLRYRTETPRFVALATEGKPDALELSVDVPGGARKASLVLRLKNTLLSTVLFYDVVLGSQGIEALSWNARMNSDTAYAMQFKQIYETFSGMSVSVMRDNGWSRVSRIGDIGPISWKNVAVDLPLDASGRLNVRLEFFPDNFLIDYAGFSFDSSESRPPEITELSPDRIEGGPGERSDVIMARVREDDGLYLVTNPGDSYRLEYSTRLDTSAEYTMFVSSNGYYTEWLRGEWLHASREGYRFDLSHVQRTLSELVQSWLLNRAKIEEKFFHTRIPVRSPQ